MRRDERTDTKRRWRRWATVVALAFIVLLGLVVWVVPSDWLLERKPRPEAGTDLVYWGDPPGCEGWSTSPSDLLEPDFFATATAKTVAECLYAGTRVDARPPGGDTVLMRAAQKSKDSKTLLILMGAGADPNARASQGGTALHRAAFWRTRALEITALLEGGSDPNLRYHGLNGVTALHLAAEKGNVDGVSILLDHGADSSALDDRGRTPLGTAARTFGGRWGRHGYHAKAIMVARELLDNGSNASELEDHGWKALHTAALLSKDRSGIVDLIGQGHDPDVKTPSGWTALHIAALVNERAGVIEALLEAGANSDARFGNGRTPLHCAAFANGNPEVIATLVAGGADPGARTTIGWTPLHAAAYGNMNPEIVEALVEAGANVESMLADSWDGKIHFPNELSLMDAPSLVTLDGRWETIDGSSTPLHVAAGHSRNPAVVTALVDGGADPNSRNMKGETPLFNAMAGLLRDDVDLAVVGQLLEAGADPNARSEIDQTPLHSAVNFGLLEAATVLLDGGADPNAGGWTPLHGAASRPSIELTSLLLARGADPNARNTEYLLFHIPGDTPLHSAADSNSDLAVIEALLRGGADANARNGRGRTALFSAAAPSLGESNEVVVRRLIEAGADPNVRDRGGKTPLIAALTRDVVDPTVVTALLDGGADASLRDQEGVTPWDLVEKRAALRDTELYWRLNDGRFD